MKRARRWQFSDISVVGTYIESSEFITHDFELHSLSCVHGLARLQIDHSERRIVRSFISLARGTSDGYLPVMTA
jgi:hypothetical protein